MQNRRLRLDYEATESWLFSLIKLIWGIFISVQMRTKVVREWTLVLNKHSKIPEVILEYLLLIKNWE